MSALDAALAAINEAVPVDADNSKQLIAAKARGLMVGYHARWKDAGYTVFSVERTVTADLRNPETSAKSRTFNLAGKIDVTVCSLDSRVLVVDHKTTSDDIADPNSTYWRQLAIEGQVSQYMLLEWANGRKADGALWDVVKKPGISPKKLAKADIKAAIVHGRYCGMAMQAEDIIELQETERETLSMYTARLAFDCTHERPQHYFARRPVPRLDADLYEYACEAWEHSQEIIHARRLGRWARNSGACMTYGMPCKFLGICSGHDTPDSEKWQRKPSVHVELPDLTGDGRNWLTNSRIRTFQTCRKKHYYEYELGIERVEEEEREALYFGNVWHLAQQAWWEAQPKETEHEYSNGVEVIEVSTANDETAVVF